MQDKLEEGNKGGEGVGNEDQEDRNQNSNDYVDKVKIKNIEYEAMPSINTKQDNVKAARDNRKAGHVANQQKLHS